ncbi:hypothetical protein LCGC14_2542100 [marine sediment metagenome]|uniref:Uncharacterized protein n=1 Tax=marine sediment metagenome TaxID=412755 RepID=A0A0F9AQG5_9ZZZZ
MRLGRQSSLISSTTWKETNMEGRFKVGDKVKIVFCPLPDMEGKEGTVSKLGGRICDDEGVIVTSDNFFNPWNKNGMWFPDDWLELVT